MFNLKKANGTYKGLVGECMFKMSRKYAVINKYWNREKYFLKFAKYLIEKQIEFLIKNWYSLDAIEIMFSEDQKLVVLYEIKTKNAYSKELGFKPKITMSTVNLYKKAESLGFCVKIANVIFLDDWNYEIKMVDFLPGNYCIDKPKRYDKKSSYQDLGPE